ncbi:cytochrome ubiquinol oxidase subunit I [Methylotenera sp.]|uniref:cytochrome ubiquinol oxidase subunit I n=1 Tax=Methylotenera sp. TaxID=2051956 RepID=UPI002488DB32|nr:cytochrome ubiquinol oxidase subunit I [Methylotenera sp.]MDI1299290.1 cytochrome ubiquinol oxidase subunit I [Methylotenera sp.]
MLTAQETILGFNALDFARVQFAFTISFHIVFPALTIGLASYLAVLEGFWLKTGKQVYKDLYHYWLKIFGVIFGMGVVSGLVMSYQFGTNWGSFSEFAGGVTGPLLAYEVLTAFFMEAGFLGVMMFGWNRVGRGLHFFATLMVTVGTLISMTWIIASNSWMQTPQGFSIVNNIVIPTDWWAIVFNPSFPYRLVHMAMAAFLATSLFVGASAAWQILRKQDTDAGRVMLSMSMWMLMFVAPLQILAGDMHGLNTLEYQPAKIAAMEGHWEKLSEAKTDKGMPLVLFAIPSQTQEKNLFSIEIPHVSSLILTHSLNGQIKGLKDFAVEDRPNVNVLFWSFRIMVALGSAMLLAGLASAYLRYKKQLYTSKIFLWAITLMGPTGLIAILAGWITTEAGRQPWVVYGVMRTKDAVSLHDVSTLALSLALFVFVYIFVFGIGVAYVLRLIRKPPVTHEGDEPIGHDNIRLPVAIASEFGGRS